MSLESEINYGQTYIESLSIEDLILVFVGLRSIIVITYGNLVTGQWLPSCFTGSYCTYTVGQPLA